MARKKDIEGLIPHLEAEDAFERLEAEDRLRELVQRDFGYRWDAPAPDREAALARLRAWLKGRVKRKAEVRKKAEAAGFAAVTLEDLKGMTPQQVEEHLQQLLSKAQFFGGISIARPRCEGCGKRASTVEIVDILPGAGATVSRLCDACAADRGDIHA